MPFDDIDGRFTPEGEPRDLRFSFLHSTRLDVDQKECFKLMLPVVFFFRSFLFGRGVLAVPEAELFSIPRTSREGINQQGVFFNGKSNVERASAAFEGAAAAYNASTGGMGVRITSTHSVFDQAFYAFTTDRAPEG